MNLAACFACPSWVKTSESPEGEGDVPSLIFPRFIFFLVCTYKLDTPFTDVQRGSLPFVGGHKMPHVR